MRRFNSRSREGSDGWSFAARGAARGFNSRSREGSDNGVLWYRYLFAQFQFALPRGERPMNKETKRKVWRFNSRSREGSDVSPF